MPLPAEGPQTQTQSLQGHNVRCPTNPPPPPPPPAQGKLPVWDGQQQNIPWELN